MQRCMQHWCVLVYSLSFFYFTTDGIQGNRSNKCPTLIIFKISQFLIDVINNKESKIKVFLKGYSRKLNLKDIL